jgi:hypothetical protein
MWRRVRLLTTEDSEEYVASLFRVEKTCERRKALVVILLINDYHLSKEFSCLMELYWDQKEAKCKEP